MQCQACGHLMMVKKQWLFKSVLHQRSNSCLLCQFTITTNKLEELLFVLMFGKTNCVWC